MAELNEDATTTERVIVKDEDGEVVETIDQPVGTDMMGSVKDPGGTNLQGDNRVSGANDTSGEQKDDTSGDEPQTDEEKYPGTQGDSRPSASPAWEENKATSFANGNDQQEDQPTKDELKAEQVEAEANPTPINEGDDGIVYPGYVDPKVIDTPSGEEDHQEALDQAAEDGVPGAEQVADDFENAHESEMGDNGQSDQTPAEPPEEVAVSDVKPEEPTGDETSGGGTVVFDDDE